MRYTLVPTPARKKGSSKPRLRKHSLKHQKGGFHGVSRLHIDRHRRYTRTQRFRDVLSHLLSKWGIHDPYQRRMAWQIMYAHRIEPWYRSQEALREVLVQVRDARNMDTSTLRGEYAFIQRMKRIDARRLFWEEKARLLWENPPIALRHVLKGAAPAVWKDFLRQM